jgi:hypothetical protein
VSSSLTTLFWKQLSAQLILCHHSLSSCRECLYDQTCHFIYVMLLSNALTFFSFSFPRPPPPPILSISLSFRIRNLYAAESTEIIPNIVWHCMGDMWMVQIQFHPNSESRIYSKVWLMLGFLLVL